MDASRAQVTEQLRTVQVEQYVNGLQLDDDR